MPMPQKTNLQAVSDKQLIHSAVGARRSDCPCARALLHSLRVMALQFPTAESEEHQQPRVYCLVEPKDSTSL